MREALFEAVQACEEAHMQRKVASTELMKAVLQALPNSHC
jgi:hypothetical protein